MSEYHIPKETIQGFPFQYGISISNLANETNPDLSLPDKTGDVIRMLAEVNMGVEFQIESPERVQFEMPQCSRPAFVGVHLPIRDVDFLDPGKRDQSYRYGLRNIEYAQEIDADYVVIHMLSKNEWDRIEQRPEMIAEAKEHLEELVRRGKGLGYEGKYLFENLEFPLYPSTAAEVRDLQGWVNFIAQRQNVQTGLCLDLGHLWHTGLMIEINRHKGDVMKPYVEDPYAAGVTDYVSYLTPLVEEIAGDLDLIHMTGTHIHQTHLQPQIGTAVRASDRVTLNLQQSMQHISQILSERGKNIFVVNEAHSSRYEEMVHNNSLVRSYFSYGRT